MKLLKAASLIVADPEASATRYAQWFGYRTVEHGAIDASLATSWGAANAAGARYVLCQPASGAEVYLRFIEGATPPTYAPLRSHGWAALELCVRDVEALHARLITSPFEIIGPPRLLDSMPEIYPMQVLGPDQEIVYLTEIRGDQSGVILPRAQSLVDHLFILVAGCADVSASFAWFEDVLGLSRGVDVAITYSMINRAFDLPPTQKHRLITGLHGTDCFLELDQYPSAAIARPRTSHGLPAGITHASFVLPDIAHLDARWVAPPVSHPGALYQGSRVGVLRGPDDILVELIEAV